MTGRPTIRSATLTLALAFLIGAASPSAGWQSAGQPMLFRPEANLDPVREWVLGKLKEEPMRWKELRAAFDSKTG
jgi:hypothetical protein